MAFVEDRFYLITCTYTLKYFFWCFILEGILALLGVEDCTMPVLKRMELYVVQMTCCKQQYVHPDRSKIDYPQKNNTQPKNIFSRLSGFLGQCFICDRVVCFSTSQGQDINSQ
jgi:hypothetical protein